MKSNLVKIHSESSAVSGTVEVWQDEWERKLLIGGATQSIFRLDGTERGYWLGFAPPERPEMVLILGLGGGTIARILRKKWPLVKIVGYELDPVVVRVATSYFGLDPLTEVRVQDFRESLKTPETYDLVVVDLYVGNKYVGAAEQESFLTKLPAKLSPGGMVGFNRIPSFSNQSQLAIFERQLRDIFREVWIAKADHNLIYWSKN